MKIQDIVCRAVYGSNGNPTLEIEIITDCGKKGRSIASGTCNIDNKYINRKLSLNILRDNIDIFNKKISPFLKGVNCSNQREIDKILQDLELSFKKDDIGTNVIVATSMASAKTAAQCLNLPLFKYLRLFSTELINKKNTLPIFNIIDGVIKSDIKMPIVPFLLFPSKNLPLEDALEMGVRVLNKVKELLWVRGSLCGHGEQGGILTNLKNCEYGFDLIMNATKHYNYQAKKDFFLGIDFEADRFYNNGAYMYNGACSKGISADVLLKKYLMLLNTYPITYIEDAFSKNDFPYWKLLLNTSPSDVLIVGDDLFHSSLGCLKNLHTKKLANAFLLKPDRVNTITNIIKTIEEGHTLGLKSIVSHRTKENDDSFLAHIAVATNADFLKAGGMSKMDRVSKFNELVRIYGK